MSDRVKHPARNVATLLGRIAACMVLMGAALPAARAAITPGSITIGLQRAASGLIAPVALAHAGDSRLFVVEQTGQIRIIRDGALVPAPFLDISAKVYPLNSGYDERGLLGLSFHPDYRTNGKFYVYYSAPGAITGYDHHSRISEFTVSAANPDAADAGSERLVLRIDEPNSNHNGGDLAFGPDGYLYITSGDGGASNDEGPLHTPIIGNAQDLTKLLGKILRIDVDHRDPGLEYAVPPDNPFAGSQVARGEIFCYGLRNPYRFSFDSGGSRQMFVGDVGQRLIEEVDICEKGGNYGWRAYEGTQPFAQLPPPPSPYIGPLAEYDHTDGVAVIGGYVYRGGAIAELAGKYLFGDLGLNNPPRGRFFYLDPSEQPLAQIRELQLTPAAQLEKPFYIKGFGQGANGELYALVSGSLGPSGSNGKVLRILTQTMSIGAARRLGAGLSVSFAGKTVTRAASDRYYIEDTDRSAGIAVMLPRSWVAGSLVNVSGTLGYSAGELVITNASDSAAAGAATVGPLGIANRAATLALTEGLLVKVWGTVVAAGASGNIRIDDGSDLRDSANIQGLRIIRSAGTPLPAAGQYVTVIGPRGMAALSPTENAPVVYLTESGDLTIGP